MGEEHIIVLIVRMLKINKKKSKLICITGFMGCGKTTATLFYNSLGYKTFIMDDYIHEIYNVGQIGYEIIKENFGFDYLDEFSVNRTKLRELIKKDKLSKIKLNKLMLDVMLKKIEELYFLDEKIIVELGIYIYNQEVFFKYFNKIILIQSNREDIIDNFKEFHNGIKFSTKDVENNNNVDFNGIIYVDFIVDNNNNLSFFEKNLKKLLNFF